MNRFKTKYFLTYHFNYVKLTFYCLHLLFANLIIYEIQIFVYIFHCLDSITFILSSRIIN